MSKKIKLFLFTPLFLFVIMLFYACPEAPVYSDIPKIDFKQYRLYDTIDDINLGNSVKGLILKFGLIDGDGDIGLNPGDTIGIDIDSNYVNNFLSILYEIKAGDTTVVDSVSGYNFRIPDISQQGQNTVLMADVFINIMFNYRNDKLDYDSIFFDFFVIDRELNKSNIERTPIIMLNSSGYFPPETE